VSNEDMKIETMPDPFHPLTSIAPAMSNEKWQMIYGKWFLFLLPVC
jgi:hypothetical protein